MSWFRRAALFLCLPLAGCFQPLYSETANPGLADAMRSVEIAPISDRIGHYLGEELRHDINDTGETPARLYRLVATVDLSTQTPTIQAQNGIASAATSVGTAHFTLTRLADDKVLIDSKAMATAVYDRTAQRFADLRAARDAEVRIARSLATEIELRVAAAIADAPPVPVTAPAQTPSARPHTP